MKTKRAANWLAVAIAAVLVAWGPLESAGAERKTEHVFLITTDGLRWEEVFTGAEERLISKEFGNVSNTGKLREKFWRGTARERREALLPFFWSHVAVKGQVFGNPEAGSRSRVTNGKNFSYPGYSELLAGKADDRIDSNAKRPNPNVTVLEYLNGRPGFEGKVVAFGCWDVFPYIINAERAGLPVYAGWEMLDRAEIGWERINEILRRTPHYWDNVMFDPFMVYAARDYIEKRKPRVVYLAFGETDDWAHHGRYDLYLQAAHHFDQFLREVWEMTEATPEYAGKTTFIVTTDHGRGNGTSTWKDHGEGVPESEQHWMAVFGPDTKPLGERHGVALVEQNQIAATLAAFLGERFAGEGRGNPITSVLP